MSAVSSVIRKQPGLVPELVRTAWAFRARSGVIPSRPLIRWRTATAYGSPAAAMLPEDLERFLEWRRQVRSFL